MHVQLLEKKGWLGRVLAACTQAIIRWTGVPVDAGDGFAYNMDRPMNCAGQTVTTGAALQLSAVWACVSLLSDTISTLPLGFYQKTPQGRKSAEDHRLHRVFRRQPNADMTTSQFLGATIASMLLRGMGYWEKQLSAGRVIGLEFLPFDCVSWTKQWDGSRKWFVTEDGKRREISETDLVRIPGFSLDGKNGLSAIAYGCRVFGNAIAADTAAAGTFERGLMPTTVFKYPATLKESQRNEAREAITSLSGAINAGRPVILEGGTEALDIGINPRDAQLLESRAFSVEDICSWFRVQPFMIGRASQGQTNWGTGIEQQMIGFVMFTLRPWLKRIEETIAKDLLLPSERDTFYAEFALEGLLRGDSAARREFYASALQNGWMNRATVAQLENLPPPPGGEIYTVQSNLVPLDQLGQAASGEAVRAALNDWLRGIPQD